MVMRLRDSLCGEGYNVRIEVPNMGQSIDVVATKNRWITAVEAKLTNWRRALAQCVAHEQVADFICIAVGTGGVSDALFAEANNRGYGIIHCAPTGNCCHWVLRPRRNRQVWRPQRNQLAAALRVIRYER